MNKFKRKEMDNIYFSENIDSKGEFYADKSVFLVSAIIFLATFLVFLVFQIFGYKGENYWINLLQLFGGLVFLCIPLILRRFKLYVNSYLAIIWYIFVISTWYVGMNFEVYKLNEWYDKIVHLYSGAVIGLIGLTFVNMNGTIKNKCSTFFTVIAFTALAGLIWEIIEFTYDGILGDNTQRYNEEATGIAFIGREALYDTMFDMIADILGGIILAIILMFMKKDQIARLAIAPKSQVAPIVYEVIATKQNDKLNNTDIEKSEDLNKDLL